MNKKNSLIVVCGILLLVSGCYFSTGKHEIRLLGEITVQELDQLEHLSTIFPVVDIIVAVPDSLQFTAITRTGSELSSNEVFSHNIEEQYETIIAQYITHKFDIDSTKEYHDTLFLTVTMYGYNLRNESLSQ